MNKKTIGRIHKLLFIPLLIIFGWYCSRVWIGTEQGAEESAQKALFVQVEKDLDKFYEAKGHYPKSLYELEISHYGNGSSPETLKSFKYSSEGNLYSCEMTGARTGNLYKLPTARNVAKEKP